MNRVRLIPIPHACNYETSPSLPRVKGPQSCCFELRWLESDQFLLDCKLN